MRLYLEAKEQGTDDPEFIRTDVTDMTETEKTDALNLIKQIMPRAVYSRHFCRHDESKPCSIEKI